MMSVLLRTAALALPLATACSRGPEHPDVVLFLVDTLRADRLWCYGYELPTSPCIDRLATEGALFADVTAQAPWTLPSVVSLFHGRYLTEQRMLTEPSWPTLAEAFRAAGYRTIGVVANPALGVAGEFDRGFDRFDVGLVEDENGMRTRTVDEVRAILAQELDEELAVEREGPRPPLLVYVHLMDPHAPYDSYPDLDDAVPVAGATAPMPRPWQSKAYPPSRWADDDEDPEWRMRWRWINEERGRYDQGVRATDEGIAGMLADLDARGLLEHAVVCVLSDHGECLWERLAPKSRRIRERFPPDEFFYQSHGASVTQESVATPLVFWGAGVPSGARIAAPVENVDVLPTLLELAGIALPGPVDGRSLVPAMRGAESDEQEYVFSRGSRSVMVREIDTGLKLIVADRTKARVPPTLHHLPSDPDELVDLYGERMDDAQRLHDALLAWQVRYPPPAPEEASGEQKAILKDLGYTAADIGE